MDNMSIDEVQQRYRKLNNLTSYEKTFGSKPKATEDYEILKFRKLKEMKMGHILKPHIEMYLEKWIQIND